MQNLEINSNQIDKIKKITKEEKNFRIKNLKLFKSSGFPNKRLEDWKFTDFKNERVSSSFSPFALRIEFNDVFKKLFVLTPGISKGY